MKGIGRGACLRAINDEGASMPAAPAQRLHLNLDLHGSAVDDFHRRHHVLRAHGQTGHTELKATLWGERIRGGGDTWGGGPEGTQTNRAQDASYVLNPAS